jgi:hypothetical protein
MGSNLLGTGRGCNNNVHAENCFASTNRVCFVCKQNRVCLTIRITREQEVRATPEKTCQSKGLEAKNEKRSN